VAVPAFLAIYILPAIGSSNLSLHSLSLLAVFMPSSLLHLQSMKRGAVARFFLSIARLALLLGMWYLCNIHGIVNQTGSIALAAVKANREDVQRAICLPHWLPGADLLPRWGATVATDLYYVQNGCVTFLGLNSQQSFSNVKLNPFFAAKITKFNITSKCGVMVNGMGRTPSSPLTGVLLRQLEVGECTGQAWGESAQHKRAAQPRSANGDQDLH